MNDQSRVVERLGVALNAAENNVDRWEAWKLHLVLKKAECLLAIMDTKDRRTANRI